MKSELDSKPDFTFPGPEDLGKLVDLSKPLIFLWDEECVRQDGEGFNKIIITLG